MRRAKPLLGTFVEIAVAGADDGEAAVEAAFAAVARVHRLMSFHAPDSDLSRLNREAASRPVAPSGSSSSELSGRTTFMAEQDTSGNRPDNRDDDRNEELEESPVPDPEATNGDADDDPGAD